MAQTKKKKEEQYKKIAVATSQLFSKTLTNFGNKLRSRLAHHMASNNMISKKQLMDPVRKAKNRKKINLKRDLRPVEPVAEVSYEDS